VVIDGYIEGATVCLDVNANLRCDSAAPELEPTAQSDEKGNYTLPPYFGSIDGLRVIAIVEPGDRDSDFGVVTKPFDLLAPAESAQAITPLTSMVVSDMTARKVSAEEAERSVIAQLNLQSTKLLGVDPTRDSELLRLAQVTTAAMAATKEELRKLNDEQNLGLDRAAIVKAAIEEVKSNILPQLVAPDGKVEMSTSGQSQAQLATAIASKADLGRELSGKVQFIAARSRAGDGTVFNAANFFKEGFLLLSMESGDYLDSQGRRTGRWDAFKDRLVAEFLQYDLSSGRAMTFSERVWLTDGVEGRNWYPVYYPPGEVTHGFDGTRWVSWVEDGQGQGRVPRFLDNCVLLPIAEGSEVGQKICGVVRDLSGRRMAEFLQDQQGNSLVCKDFYTRSSVPNCDPEQRFPGNSMATDLTLSSSGNLYEIWTGERSWRGYSYAGSDSNDPAVNQPSIDKFLALLERSQMYISSCRIGMKVDFDGMAADRKSGRMRWWFNSQSCGTSADAYVRANSEETTFIVETVGGKEVLRVGYPNLYRKLNPGEVGPTDMLFAVFEKDIELPAASAGASTTQRILGIFSGEFTRADRPTTIPFTGNLGAASQVVNRVLFEALLKARGISEYSYPSE
jgi:hypothetical protein